VKLGWGERRPGRQLLGSAERGIGAWAQAVLAAVQGCSGAPPCAANFRHPRGRDERTRADDRIRVLLVQRRMRSMHASWRATEGSEAIPVSGLVWLATTASRSRDDEGASRSRDDVKRWARAAHDHAGTSVRAGASSRDRKFFVRGRVLEAAARRKRQRTGRDARVNGHRLPEAGFPAAACGRIFRRGCEPDNRRRLRWRGRLGHGSFASGGTPCRCSSSSRPPGP
jgi:hypothetical protein